MSAPWRSARRQLHVEQALAATAAVGRFAAQEFQANPNLVIYIRADENSRMKDFVALTDACTSKGIARYSIRTQPPQGGR